MGVSTAAEEGQRLDRQVRAARDVADAFNRGEHSLSARDDLVHCNACIIIVHAQDMDAESDMMPRMFRFALVGLQGSAHGAVDTVIDPYAETVATTLSAMMGRLDARCLEQWCYTTDTMRSMLADTNDSFIVWWARTQLAALKVDSERSPKRNRWARLVDLLRGTRRDPVPPTVKGLPPSLDLEVRPTPSES